MIQCPVVQRCGTSDSSASVADAENSSAVNEIWLRSAYSIEFVESFSKAFLRCPRKYKLLCQKSRIIGVLSGPHKA